MSEFMKDAALLAVCLFIPYWLSAIRAELKSISKKLDSLENLSHLKQIDRNIDKKANHVFIPDHPMFVEKE